MTKAGRGPGEFDDGALLALFAAIASRDDVGVTRMLDQTPGLATYPLRAGATRQDPRPASLSRFVTTSTPATRPCMSPPPPITVDSPRRSSHKALRFAPATEGEPNRSTTPQMDARARTIGFEAQREVIFYLIAAGADPDAIDKSGERRCIEP